MTTEERRVHEQGSTEERDAARRTVARMCARANPASNAGELAEAMGALGLLGDDTVETLLIIGRLRRVDR